MTSPSPTSARSRLGPALALVTLLDVCLIITDEPMGAELARALGINPYDASAPSWVWVKGLRGWVPPFDVYSWKAAWAWHLVPRPVAPALLLLYLAVVAAGAAALVAIHRRSGAPSRAGVVVGLALLVLIGWGLEMIAIRFRAANVLQAVTDVTESSGYAGYVDCADQIEHLSAFFAPYVDVLSRMPRPGHCLSHPPGGVLFFWLIERVLRGLAPSQLAGLISYQRAAGVANASPGVEVKHLAGMIGGELILLWSACVVVPCYFIARRVAGPARALFLSSFGVLIPSIVLVSPQLDQVYAMLSATVLACALEGTATRPRLFGLLAGLTLAVAIFFSYGVWILIAPLALLLIGSAVVAARNGNRARVRRILTVGLSGAAATAGFWGLLWYGAGFDVPKALEIARHAHLGLTEERPYEVWSILNLVDFLQHLGPPLALSAALCCVRSRPDGQSKVINWYFILFWVTILSLDATGWTRGEVGRLWTCLVPLALVGLFEAVAQGTVKMTELAGLAAGQVIVCAVMAWRWTYFL